MKGAVYMAKAGDFYIVQVLEPHVNWVTYRNPTNREPIEGESYVKIPAEYARKFDIIRDTQYTAYFSNGQPSILIKASGNGPCDDGIQYAKQFEGIGKGACKAFTPWYTSCGIKAGDHIKVEFLSPTEILFSKE